MHRRLGRVTLSQLAFPGESNPNFPRKKPKMTQYSCKINLKKNKKIKRCRAVVLYLYPARVTQIFPVI